MKLDLIKNDKEFEHFCKWVARDNFGPNVFLYSSYTQNGIDIYWIDKGRYHVIQCKQRSNPNPSELINALENDFNQAKAYFHTDLKQFIFATTASLEIIESKIRRKNGLEESVLSVCNRLTTEHNVDVVPWHWDYLEEKVTESPFLLRHLLKREEGADIIDDDFIENLSQKYKGTTERQCKLDYYGGEKDIQWYGILKNFDAPREIYNSVITNISSSFEKNEPVACVIRGEGGSGKSVFLRRLAFDLRKQYTVYWLDWNIEAFLNNELVYDIQRHSECQYIIFLEDWYLNIERLNNKDLASHFLNKLKKIKNARVIIGDRKYRRKIYDEYVRSSHIYDLSNEENINLLKSIFEKMPEWGGFISEPELNYITNASLFIALFVFCYGDHSDKISLSDRYKRIFKSDYNKFLEKDDPFEKWIPNCLHLYANIYSNYGITLTVQSIIQLICHYSNSPIPLRYQDDNKKLFNLPLLKKYFHIKEVDKKASGTVERLRFHHDTMAEQGWANKHELVEITFDETGIYDLITILNKTNRIWDIAPLYFYLSKLPGEKGKTAAREYLEITGADKDQSTFSVCINLLKGEEAAKKAARIFLKTDKPYANHWVFNKCIQLLKEEKLAKQVVEEFLGIDKPYKFNHAFSYAITFLHDYDIAREKAREFLGTDKPYRHKEAYCNALELLKGELIAKEKAIEFIRIDNRFEFKEVFSNALELLKGDELAKKAAEDYIRKYIADDIEFIPDTYCVALDELGNQPLTKEAAKKYLQNGDAKELQRPYNKSIKLLGIDAQDYALEIIKNYTTESNWNFVYESLKIIGNLPQYQNYIDDIIKNIFQNKQRDWHKYREVLKIPLFGLPRWVKETEKLISTWEEQTGSKRNYLLSMTYSHIEFPEKFNKMSIGIIRNWKQDLTCKTKHKAYFTRCLANIAVTGDDNLKKEVIEICNEICKYHQLQPLQLTPDLEMWLKKVATAGEFPNWNFNEQHYENK